MKTRGWIALSVGLAAMLALLALVWYWSVRPREGGSQIPGSGIAPRPAENGSDSEGASEVESTMNDAFLSAISVVNDKRLRDGHDPTVVRAIRILRERKDARAIPGLVAGITFCAPGDGRRGPASGNQRNPSESYPAVPAIVEFGESALPFILAAFAEGVEPDSQREHFLLSCLGAILGPHKGVKRLEDAIAKAQAPKKQEKLRAALKAFREFRLVIRWSPEGEAQPFEGNIYEELQKAQGSVR